MTPLFSYFPRAALLIKFSLSCSILNIATTSTAFPPFTINLRYKTLIKDVRFSLSYIFLRPLEIEFF